MDDKNQSCLVLQYNNENVIVGIDKTTTYNFWEKEAYIEMNKKTLFPCSNDKVTFNNFDEWSDNTDAILIDYDVNLELNIDSIQSQVFYPGY